MLQEGYEYAKAKMREDEEIRLYFGDENVTKWQKHDGEFVYQMRENVVKEMLKIALLIKHAIEFNFTTTILHRNENEYNEYQKALMRHIAFMNPQQDIIQSIYKCFKGQPMYSFYRDEQALEIQRTFEKEREKIQELWRR